MSDEEINSKSLLELAFLKKLYFDEEYVEKTFLLKSKKISEGMKVDVNREIRNHNEYVNRKKREWRLQKK